MLASRWHKVLHDLWGNKTRTLLIVLSITVGLFALGTIVSARTILDVEMARSFAAIHPSSGTVRTQELFDDSFVQSVRKMPEVDDADARRMIFARIQVGSGQWNTLIIFAIEDYDDIRINKIWSQSGAWPPPEGQILIERAALPVIQAQVGDVILIETPDKKQRHLRIAGTAHDPAQLPAQIDGTPYGYISVDTLKWLGEPYGFNELYVTVRNADDPDYAQQVVNRVKSKAERNGLTIPLSMVVEPGQLPLDELLQAILLLMGALGVLSLFLSVFLIINTVSALLAQQKRQIGVMKAIGASTGQIMGMYLSMVVLYGVVALFFSIPLSIAGARGLSQFMAAMFNFDLANLNTPPQAILLQIGVGVLVPVLASLYPFLVNLRVTAVEAMSAYRLGRGRFGTNWLDRLLSGANLWFARYVLMRPLILSLRNTFRSKGRLLLTLTTLILGGATFISVFSLNDSVESTLDDVLRQWNFDALITFKEPVRAEKVQLVAQQLPEVVETDIWLSLATRRVRPDGSEGKSIYMFAPRADSRLFLGPGLVQGRWLLPEDDNAVVVDTSLLKEESDLKLGDEVVFKVKGRNVPFRIVGVTLGMVAPMIYTNYTYIAPITGSVGHSDAALVATEHHDLAGVTQIAADLETRFKRAGLRVETVATIAMEKTEAEAFFGIIVNLLLIMALLLAVVGGLGLMGTMSINVLERTREIGVLRAIGAPNLGVAWVFIREGMAIGLLSWLISAVLAWPLGKTLSDAVGTALIGTPLRFSYSLNGLVLWLILVLFLSALASFFPARNASRLTVREVLAYE